MRFSDSELVEVDRVTVRQFGGSLYMLLPKVMRKADGITVGDQLAILRASGSTDAVIRRVPPAKSGS